jgi:hypothetical protein
MFQPTRSCAWNRAAVSSGKGMSRFSRDRRHDAAPWRSPSLTTLDETRFNRSDLSKQRSAEGTCLHAGNDLPRGSRLAHRATTTMKRGNESGGPRGGFPCSVRSGHGSCSSVLGTEDDTLTSSTPVTLVIRCASWEQLDLDASVGPRNGDLDRMPTGSRRRRQAS